MSYKDVCTCTCCQELMYSVDDWYVTVVHGMDHYVTTIIKGKH